MCLLTNFVAVAFNGLSLFILSLFVQWEGGEEKGVAYDLLMSIMLCFKDKQLYFDFTFFF